MVCPGDTILKVGNIENIKSKRTSESALINCLIIDMETVPSQIQAKYSVDHGRFPHGFFPIYGNIFLFELFELKRF